MGADTSLVPWRPALRLGAWCAFVSVALIPVSMLGFAFWPPPATAAESFAQFDRSFALGLLGLDALYLVINALTLPFYLSLTVATWRDHRAYAAPALLCGAVGIALLFASGRSLEMGTLAAQYASASEASRPALLAVGEALLAETRGTAFVAYYWLNAIALFLYAWAMSPDRFSRALRHTGLAAALLMLVPSTFGAVGMAFALASLPPWIAFAILAGRRLLALSDDEVAPKIEGPAG